MVRKRKQESILVSPLIESRRFHEQCLRFCFNAFTRVKKAKRQLEVWMQYTEDDGNMDDDKYKLFNFSSLSQSWGLYWNHTEINIKAIYDKPYKVRILLSLTFLVRSKQEKIQKNNIFCCLFWRFFMIDFQKSRYSGTTKVFL